MTSATGKAPKPPAAFARAIWAATLLLCLIGVAVVIRRGLQLLSPGHALPSPPGQAGLDAGFSRHRLLTLVHIVPGLLFVLLAPLQFVQTLRTRRPRVHRVVGWVSTCSGFVIGGSALIMSPQMAIGGIVESAATMFFALLFLFSLAKGLAAIRKRRIAEHREWMIRAFAIGLAVAFVRPIVGIFFATSHLTHLTPHDFFGAAFWLGFTIQTIAGEAWIYYTRTRPTFV